MPRVYIRNIARSTMYQKSSILLAGTDVWKISSAACGFSLNWFQVFQTNNWSCITSPPAYPDVNGDVDVTKTMQTQ